MATILVVDDEELIRWTLATHLATNGHTVEQAANGAECVEAVHTHRPDIVVLDLRMPVMDGLAALRKLRADGSDVAVVMLTAHGAVDAVIEATKLGAAAWLSKPFHVREVSAALDNVLEQIRMRREVHYLRSRERAGYGEFLGSHPGLEPLYEILGRLEHVDAPTVLILGPSGAGKDVLARMIHERGPRSTEPFVAIDCAALPEQLIESELFGHERGAFTDARNAKTGLFEVAAKGTVFLDEIGELPLGMQAKLLRALEDRTFRRVGGTERMPMNVSLVAATNRDLRKDVEQGRFREDLYFRLDVVRLKVPPLRERASDVPVIVGHFLDRFSRQFGRTFRGVDGAAMELLQAYAWPGNVRELRNVMERLVILCPAEVIRSEDLPSEIRFTLLPNNVLPHEGRFVLPEEGVDLEAVEKDLVKQALERAAGNQTAAARLLGISRFALRYRIEKFNFKRVEAAEPVS